MKYTTKKYCPIEIIDRYPSAVEKLCEMINRDFSETIINEAEKGEVIVRLGEVKEEAQAEFNGMTTVRRDINIEPLIRCKDCEYFRTPKDGNNYCDHDFGGIRCVPFENDYCSYAERRKDAIYTAEGDS